MNEKLILRQVGVMDRKIAHAIAKASDDVISGKLNDSFMVNHIHRNSGNSRRRYDHARHGFDRHRNPHRHDYDHLRC